MPKDITGVTQATLDLTLTVPVNSDTSDADRIEAIIQALLNNDVTLRDTFAGDITAVSAGTGLSGGGQTGAVTLRVADLGIVKALLAADSVDATKIDTTNTGTIGQILELAANNQLTWTAKPSGGGGGTGDIEGVTAGTGLSGGGTSGTVTIRIASLGVDTALIANDAVDATKIDTTNNGTVGQILELAANNQFTFVEKPSGGQGGGGGDITSVTAGTGLSGGGATGAVTLRVANDGITNALVADDAIDTDQIADEAVDEARLDVSNAPTAGQFLQYKDATDELTWATPSGGSGGGGLTSVAWTPTLAAGIPGGFMNVARSYAYRSGNLVFLNLYATFGRTGAWQYQSFTVNAPYGTSIPANTALLVGVYSNGLEVQQNAIASGGSIRISIAKTARNTLTPSVLVSGHYSAV